MTKGMSGVDWFILLSLLAVSSMVVGRLWMWVRAPYVIPPCPPLTIVDGVCNVPLDYVLASRNLKADIQHDLEQARKLAEYRAKRHPRNFIMCSSGARRFDEFRRDRGHGCGAWSHTPQMYKYEMDWFNQKVAMHLTKPRAAYAPPACCRP